MKDKMIYPMSLNYVKTWGVWEAVRELVSNAKDTNTEYNTEVINNELVVTDRGTGIQFSHLLLGESEKPDETAVGQFGEGLKLAILVLTRMGMPVTIHSHNLSLESGISQLAGKDVLSIDWNDNDVANFFDGTKVVVSNWNDNQNYSERFLTADDNRIFASNDNGDLVDEFGHSDLYEKGVFVTSLTNFCFGYNLRTAKMNRDRSVVSESEINSGVASIWGKIDDSNMWSFLFDKIVSDNYQEAYMDLSTYGMPDAVKEAIKSGFYDAFGENAVIVTDVASANEAKHRGATPIKISLSYYFNSAMCRLVETDKAFVARVSNHTSEAVHERDLDAEQRKTYRWLITQAKRMDYETTILLAKLPDSMSCADRSSGIITLHPDNFYDRKASLRTLIHEIAHIKSDFGDLTDEHNDYCCTLGATLSMSYMPK